MAISYTEKNLRKTCAEARRTHKLRPVALRWVEDLGGIQMVNRLDLELEEEAKSFGA